MKLKIRSFNTRVARRIFILFITCAILPVSLFAAISYFHVKKNLIDQHIETLQQESKSLSVSLYERLIFLRSEMEFIAAHLKTYSASDPLNYEVFAGLTDERFSGLSLLIGEDIKNIYGENVEPPRLTSQEMAHLITGRALLHLSDQEGPFPEFFLCLALDSSSGRPDIVTGKINPNYVLEIIEVKPPLTELIITNRSHSIMYSSIPEFGFLNPFEKNIFTSSSGNFKMTHQGVEYITGYSSLFLGQNFYYPEIIIVLGKSSSDVMAPMTSFRLFFIFIFVITFGFVLFISQNLIQKNTGPIEVLKEATEKISEGSLGYQVDIKSGDEFETLGKAFNEMSLKLTEGRKLLVNSAKMSTMGQMAAGIMHELKQPLTAIYGNLELALLDGSEGKDISRRLNISLDAVSRLNAILNRFRSFSSGSKEDMQIMSINNTITSIHELMEHELMMKNITCVIEKEGNLPPVYGDEQSLNQVVSNLLVNAIHALEEKESNDRRIGIKTFSSENQVYMSLEDNGCGIPADLQERIFDPFFTTKPSEKGTGLGMAIIKAILHEHGAFISLESKEGVGTKFTVVFPAFNMR